MAYLTRALNMSVLHLAIVGSSNSPAGNFRQFLASAYPGLTSAGILTGAGSLNCTGLAADVALQGSLSFFPPLDEYIYGYSSEAELEAYIASSDYGNNDGTPGVWAAVVWPDGTPAAGAAWSYTIRANASDVFDTHAATSDLTRAVDLTKITKFMYSSAYSYGTAGAAPLLPLYQPGFIALQTAVDKFILSQTTGDRVPPAWTPSEGDLAAFAADWGCLNPEPLATPGSAPLEAVSALLASHALMPQRVAVAPFPISSFKNDDFYTFVGQVFALIFVMTYFFPSFFLIRGLVV